MSRLLIVTALMPEAVPLINFYRMKKRPKQAFYHLFQTVSSANRPDIHLLVCGIGADKMHQGLEAYLNAVDQSERTLYLNFGIAGTLSEPQGKLLWANSIAGSGINLPEDVRNSPFSVYSQDAPCKNYRSAVLFDMEAEAWLKCIAENAQQFTPDALFCAKVVSDNRSENTHNIDKSWVINVVQKNIIELDYYVNKIIKTFK
jgi:hypothetical protein